MENNQEKEKKPSAGAMWKQTSINGKKYYNISLDLKPFMDEKGNLPEKLSIVAIMNYYKTEDKQPDYKLYKKEKREYNNDEKFDKWVKKEAQPKQVELVEREDNLGDALQIPF